MKDATYILRKMRVYTCPDCGGECYRPLQASDTNYRPFPKPCDRCDRDFSKDTYRIEDMNLAFRTLD